MLAAVKFHSVVGIVAQYNHRGRTLSVCLLLTAFGACADALTTNLPPHRALCRGMVPKMPHTAAVATTAYESCFGEDLQLWMCKIVVALRSVCLELHTIQ